MVGDTVDGMESFDAASVIVVGVTPVQSETVLLEAAKVALRYQAVLVCAYSDMHSYSVEEHPDGSVTSAPIPQGGAAQLAMAVDLGVQPTVAVFDQRLTDHITAVLVDHKLPVEFRQLAGDPAQALAQLAQTLHAELIVVGSRRDGPRAGIHEYLGRSVAVHLAHRQTRPVVVIPVPTVPHGDHLP